MSESRHGTADVLRSLLQPARRGTADALSLPELPCALAEVDAFADRAHAGQKRNTGDDTAPEVPYIVHPRAVAELLLAHPDPAARTPLVLAVALLHDVLEDCDVSHQTLEALVGPDVSAAVRALSKSLRATPGASKSPAQYWSVLAKSHLAVRRVKAADRMDNLRSCLRWRRPKLVAKYLVETPVFVLPLVVDDPWLYGLLCDALRDVRLAYDNAELAAALDESTSESDAEAPHTLGR